MLIYVQTDRQTHQQFGTSQNSHRHFSCPEDYNYIVKIIRDRL